MVGLCLPDAGRVNTDRGIFDLHEMGCYVKPSQASLRAPP
jgi:hypothetical protein